MFKKCENYSHNKNFFRVGCNHLIYLKMGTWILLRLQLIGKGVFRHKKIVRILNFPKNFGNFLKNRKKLFATTKNIWKRFAWSYFCSKKVMKFFQIKKNCSKHGPIICEIEIFSVYIGTVWFIWKWLLGSFWV